MEACIKTTEYKKGLWKINHFASLKALDWNFYDISIVLQQLFSGSPTSRVIMSTTVFLDAHSGGEGGKHKTHRQISKDLLIKLH